MSSFLNHVGHGDMPAYVVIEEGAFVEGIEVPVGWLIEFQEIPDELKSKVALVESLAEVTDYREKFGISRPNLGFKGKLK